MKTSILVLGSVNADHVLTVDQFPRPGETITGHSYSIIPGGKGANQAVACARLGGNTQFMACVGQDAFGREIVAQFAHEGIDTQCIENMEGVNTGVALIFVDGKAENCIGIASEANAALTAGYVEKHKAAIEQSDYLLMQLETPDEAILAAAKVAKNAETTVVLNPAPAKVLSDELLSHIDMITPNQTEAELLTGIAVNTPEDAQKAASILHQKGVKQVVITMGRQGAYISEQGEEHVVSGFTVTAVDTTAAGDTFNGALLVKLAEGETLSQAASFANAAAALSVTRKGAQTSIPSRSETDTLMR